MKILLATASYPPEKGGQITYIKKLCKKMADIHELTVVTYALVGYKDIQTPSPNVKVLPIDKRRPIYIRLIKFFFAILKTSKNVELICTQNTLACGLAVVLVSMITGIPFAVRFVGDEARKTKFAVFLQSFVLQRASKIITPYEYLNAQIALTYKIKDENIVVDYNPPEDKDILPFEIIKKKHQMVIITKLVEGNGVDHSIKAVAMLKDKFPDIKLVVIGDGPKMETLKKLSDDLGLSSNIDFKGKVSVAEVWKIREESEICIHNGMYEKIPDLVLLNFITKTPSIVTNIPGINEIINNQTTGILIEYGDYKSLGNAIEKLFNDSGLKQKIIENGLLALESKFSWETHISVLNSIFESIIKKPKNVR